MLILSKAKLTENQTYQKTVRHELYEIDKHKKTLNDIESRAATKKTRSCLTQHPKKRMLRIFVKSGIEIKKKA